MFSAKLRRALVGVIATAGLLAAAVPASAGTFVGNPTSPSRWLLSARSSSQRHTPQISSSRACRSPSPHAWSSWLTVVFGSRIAGEHHTLFRRSAERGKVRPRFAEADAVRPARSVRPSVATVVIRAVVLPAAHTADLAVPHVQQREIAVAVAGMTGHSESSRMSRSDISLVHAGMFFGPRWRTIAPIGVAAHAGRFGSPGTYTIQPNSSPSH